MERVGADLWTPNFGGVTSTFKLVLKDGYLDTLTTVEEPVYTDNCGFGWRFAVSTFLCHPVDQNFGTKAAYTKFYFHPHLLSGATLGILDISLQLKILGKLDEEVLQIKLTLPSNGNRPLGTYFSRLITMEDPEPVIQFTVTLPQTLGVSISNTPLPRIQRALADSTEGRDLVDTKFYLFSRCTPERRMTRPQAIFASSPLLRGHSEYLNTLLCGDGFREAGRFELDAHILDPSEDAECDYASDSDLESDDESDPIESSSEVVISPQVEPSEKKISVPAGENTSESIRRFGRIIRVNDTAYTTWKALIFYLYTTEVAFRPLRSEKRNQKPTSSVATPCSPKSMYRLADKAGLPVLQKIAFDAIRTRLTKDNILEEVFSRFTSMYPKVQEIEIEFLVTNFAPEIARGFNDVLKRMVKGELSHCYDVLSVIFEKMRKDIKVDSSIVTNEPIATSSTPDTLYINDALFTSVSASTRGSGSRGRARGR